MNKMDTTRSRGHLGNVRRLSVYSSRRSSSATSFSEAPTGGGGVGSRERLSQLEDDGHVKVAVRCRPMSEKEIVAGFESIVDFESPTRIVVHDVSEQPGDQLGTKSAERRNVSHVYDFDQVFDSQSRQADVYDSAVRPLIDQVLLGFNCTVFAYGQTGTGKTYTMEGAQERRGRSKSPTSLARRSSSSRNSASKRLQSATSGQPSPSSSVSMTSGLSGPEDNGARSRKDKTCPPESPSVKGESQSQEAGIIPRTFEQIFEHVARSPEIRFLIRASYLEIYQEEIRDLLKKDAKAKLELHERSDIGVYVKDLTSFVCKSISEIERVMRVGNQNRIVGATDMNEHSSRSHAIFTITIEQQQLQPTSEAPTAAPAAAASAGPTTGPDTKLHVEGKDGVATIRVGKLNLVDLAGSERQRKTNSSGQRQNESIKINLSLSALGNVINSLTRLQRWREQRQQQPDRLDLGDDHGGIERQESGKLPTSSQQQSAANIHTPYRDSKLTRLLQDSLGGNAKTLMIAHIGPASYNYDETINTLNYASRARCIRNRPRVNEDPKDALLRELQREIDLLRAKLAASSVGGATPSGSRSASAAADAPDYKATTRADRLSARTNAQAPEIRAKRERVAKEFAELKQKLASVEGKILNCCETFPSAAGAGASQLSPNSRLGEKVVDHQTLLKDLTREQELELVRRKEELAKQASRERAIRDELERREEAELLAKQSFESIQQEVEAKRRLVWKVLLRAKDLRDEIGAAQQANRIELDELDQLQAALQRELKLKALIMDNFVPNSHVDELLSRMSYNDRRHLCYIEPLGLPGAPLTGDNQTNPNSPAGTGCLLGSRNSSGNFSDYWRPTLGDSIRPKSEMERISEAIYPSNIRYKYEDLIEPCLDSGPLYKPAEAAPAVARMSAEAGARR